MRRRLPVKPSVIHLLLTSASIESPWIFNITKCNSKKIWCLKTNDFDKKVLIRRLIVKRDESDSLKVAINLGSIKTRNLIEYKGQAKLLAPETGGDVGFDLLVLLVRELTGEVLLQYLLGWAVHVFFPNEKPQGPSDQSRPLSWFGRGLSIFRASRCRAELPARDRYLPGLWRTGQNIGKGYRLPGMPVPIRSA